MPQAFPASLANSISQSSDKETKFRTLRVQFGDGYEMTRSDGVNTEVDSRNLVLENLTTTEATTLRTFLRAIKGWDHFTHTFPNDTAKKWKVTDGYKEVNASGDLTTFSFSIKQFF